LQRIQSLQDVEKLLSVHPKIAEGQLGEVKPVHLRHPSGSEVQEEDIIKAIALLNLKILQLLADKILPGHQRARPHGNVC
jgi:hypothetical protein